MGISRAPEHLLLVLNRFYYDGAEKKITTPVECPTRLVLPLSGAVSFFLALLFEEEEDDISQRRKKWGLFALASPVVRIDVLRLITPYTSCYIIAAGREHAVIAQPDRSKKLLLTYGLKGLKGCR